MGAYYCLTRNKHSPGALETTDLVQLGPKRTTNAQHKLFQLLNVSYIIVQE
jgi:hypothetical protein